MSPSASGADAASGANNSAISVNSSRASALSGGAMIRSCAASDFAAEPVENGIDDAWFIPFEEGMRHIDIFVNDDLDRHILATTKLVDAGAKNGPQRRVKPRKRPSFRQRTVHLHIEFALFADHAANDIVEMIRIGFDDLFIFHRPFKKMLREFVNRIFKRRPGDIHLIKRLNGTQTCSAARFGVDMST